VLVWHHAPRACGGAADASATCSGSDGGGPFGRDLPWCNPASWGALMLQP
jgi:hypothetical protein